ncbi:MAG TPA: tetratricopeptide repeat protein, partial [Hyphomicrobiaceae bacterium]|nr:tetratricopeptide repeat protein [Hyphomicrobiaceae bacterium]
DDWWFGSQYAFAQVEAGQIEVAKKTIEKSLAIFPRNAHGAHIRAHVYYESGETEAGFRYLDQWRNDYVKESPLHCHVSWHVGLWALERGDTARAWQVINDDVMPGGSWGPPLNALTDAASFLFRAELGGEARRNDLWEKLGGYAQTCFPNPGIAFADVHAALAYVMAGQSEPLEKIIREKKGPAGEMVASLAEAFSAYAKQDWQGTINLLAPVMASHERIGGSRAQRDLIEFTMLAAYLKTGQSEVAGRLLSMRRPAKIAAHPVAGL